MPLSWKTRSAVALGLTLGQTAAGVTPANLQSLTDDPISQAVFIVGRALDDGPDAEPVDLDKREPIEYFVSASGSSRELLTGYVLDTDGFPPTLRAVSIGPDNSGILKLV